MFKHLGAYWRRFWHCLWHTVRHPTQDHRMVDSWVMVPYSNRTTELRTTFIGCNCGWYSYKEPDNGQEEG
jgi:hypothetical protein